MRYPSILSPTRRRTGAAAFATFGAAVAAAVAVPQASQARVLWDASYVPLIVKNANNTTSLLTDVGRTWNLVQQPEGKQRLTITKNSRTRGSWEWSNYIMRAQLLAGDLTSTSNYVAARAEVAGRMPAKPYETDATQWPDPVGSVRYYGFTVYIPAAFPLATVPRWLSLTQWKGLRGGEPPISLVLERDHFAIGGSRVNDGKITDTDLGAVKKDTWTHFVFAISWSTTKTKGWVKVYRDNVAQTAQIPVATMDYLSGVVDPVYFKQGLYRSRDWDKYSQTAFFGPATVANAYADVAGIKSPG